MALTLVSLCCSEPSFGNGAAPRFLMIREESGADARSSSAHIILVQNWFEELKPSCREATSRLPWRRDPRLDRF